MQAQQVLRQRFSGMEVIPSTYPVSSQKVGYLARRGDGALTLGGIAAVLGGDRIFPGTGHGDATSCWCRLRGCLPRRHCRGACMGINWLESVWQCCRQNQLTATGA